MNRNFNHQFRKFLAAIALVGMVLSFGPARAGMSTVQARTSALPDTYWVYLPWVSKAVPSSPKTLTVSRTGTGSGTVSSSPAGINCGGTCSKAFNYGVSVTLTAVANANSTFTGWSGSGCSDTGTCTVTMDAARSVTATFTLNTYRLSVGTMSDGGSGTVTSSPTGIDCHPIPDSGYGPSCTYWFGYNTLVTLTATPISPSMFVGWSGESCSGTGICQVTMNTTRLVTALFRSTCIGIVNCDFESGSNVGWIESSAQGEPLIYDCADVYNCNYVTPYSGNFLAWLGGVDDEISSIQQDISITSNAPYLVYWQLIASSEVCDPEHNYDYAEVIIDGAVINKYDLCIDSNTDYTWVPHSVDLHAYAGQNVSLTLYAKTNSTNLSDLFIDYVSLQANPLGSGSITGGIPNHASLRMQTDRVNSSPESMELSPASRR